MQLSGAGRVFKGLSVAKRYCTVDSIGDTFVQRLVGSANISPQP